DPLAQFCCFLPLGIAASNPPWPGCAWPSQLSLPRVLLFGRAASATSAIKKNPYARAKQRCCEGDGECGHVQELQNGNICREYKITIILWLPAPFRPYCDKVRAFGP